MKRKTPAHMLALRETWEMLARGFAASVHGQQSRSCVADRPFYAGFHASLSALRRSHAIARDRGLQRAFTQVARHACVEMHAFYRADNNQPAWLLDRRRAAAHAAVHREVTHAV